MSNSSAIECCAIWKVFGDHASEALTAIDRDGLGRAEVFERFQSVVAVADVSFEVGEGEVFCIMGLSGSGKSTLVRHINRLIEPSRGKILIHGDDIGRKSPAELRRLRTEKIGMVFQHVAIFPHRTVRDNVAFGLEVQGADRERRRTVAEQKLALVQLAGWGDRYPDELSGGMQQRVGLARALAADPDILLMDEPFSALDPLIRRELQDEFVRLSSAMRKTTVFITHDLDEAIRLGNRIAIMKDGRFIQVGTPEAIVTAPADDYVAAFVQGVSRLSLLKASALIDYDEHVGHHLPEEWHRVHEDTALDELIDRAVERSTPIVVLGPAGTVRGLITQRSLLAGIRGRVPTTRLPTAVT
jgi:glycine betaine/proline transport system ATP-binding protein